MTIIWIALALAFCITYNKHYMETKDPSLKGYINYTKKSDKERAVSRHGSFLLSQRWARATSKARTGEAKSTPNRIMTALLMGRLRHR